MENIKRCRFSELLWEDYVLANPKEFLNEDLKKETKQNILPSGKSDLTFRDNQNRMVLVELQLDALDRKHMAQTLEYRMDYIDKGEKNIRTVLLCNEIKESRKSYIDKWNKTVPNLNLETIVISKKKVKEMIQKIDPKIKWIDEEKPRNKTISDRRIEIPVNDKLALVQAMEKRKDQILVKNLLNEFMAKNFTLLPIIHEEKMNFKLSNPRDSLFPFNHIEILHNLKKEIKDVKFAGRFTHHKSQYYEYASLVDECLYDGLNGTKQYKKLLFMPNIIDVPPESKINDQKKPEIDLILFTDTYFGRRTFRLLWQPSNWKYQSFYKEEKYHEIEKKFKSKMDDYLSKKEKGNDKNNKDDLSSIFDFSEEKNEINRERNNALQKLRQWHTGECDFLIHSDLATHYTDYGVRKEYFVIFDIKEAFPSRYVEITPRTGGLGNFWGRFGLCLSGMVKQVYYNLSKNFDVNIKGNIKYITDNLNEEDIVMLNAKYYSESENLDNYEKDNSWTSGVIKNNNKDKYKIITGFEIEDANHKIGAVFEDKIGMKAAIECI